MRPLLALAACALLQPLAAPAPAAGAAEPPAWFALVLDLTQGDVDVDITTGIRCAQGCGIVRLTLSDVGLSDLHTAAVGDHGVVVEGRGETFGVETRTAVAPLPLPLPDPPVRGRSGGRSLPP